MTNIIPFKTSKVEGLFVSVPEGATQIGLSIGRNNIMRLAYRPALPLHETREYIDLPTGHWTELCRLNEASEEQAKSIIPILEYRSSGDLYPVYDQLKGYAVGYSDVLQSLQSLAVSLGANDNDLILLKK